MQQVFKDIAFKRLQDWGFSVETFPHGFDVGTHFREIEQANIESIKEILWASNCDFLNIRKIAFNTVRVTLKE